jgi:hypothetical protein
MIRRRAAYAKGAEGTAIGTEANMRKTSSSSPARHYSSDALRLGLVTLIFDLPPLAGRWKTGLGVPPRGRI